MMNTSSEGRESSKSVVYWALGGYGVSAFEIVANCVLLILAAWIIMLNALVFDTLVRGGRGGERKPADWLVSSLSLADMINGVFILYNTIYNLANFQVRVECLVRNALLFTSLISSVLHLALLTADRYLTIILPYRYSSVCSQVSVLVCTTITWVTSLMLALLPAFGWNNADNWVGEGEQGRKEGVEDGGKEEKEDPPPVCSFFGVMHPDYLRLLVCLFFIPCLLMGICYGHIFKVARRHSREIAAQEGRGGSRDRRTWKFTKTVLIIMGLYFLSWLPVGVVILLHLEGQLDDYTVVEKGTLLMYSTLAGFTGSIINPIVYAVKISAVRARFLTIFCRRSVAVNTEFSVTRPGRTTAHAWATDGVKANCTHVTVD